MRQGAFQQFGQALLLLSKEQFIDQGSSVIEPHALLLATDGSSQGTDNMGLLKSGLPTKRIGSALGLRHEPDHRRGVGAGTKSPAVAAGPTVTGALRVAPD